MRYVLLITADDANGHQLPPAEEAQAMAGYAAFTEALQSADAMRGGERLRPSSTATTVRVRDRETFVTDGPFAETKEHLGGFYILDCESLDEAMKWAAKIPHASTGTIDIRPVPDFGP